MDSKPLVNIIIRTFNEEDWIRSCLETILNQKYSNYIITVVDSGSTDATLNIVKEYSNIKIKKLKNYLPGKAINLGMKNQPKNTNYVMLISAHCLLVGKNCIENYVNFLESNPEVAGAYGRQMPLSFTSPDDARDLLNTFGVEGRIQSKDTFFHNANSMLRMATLKKIKIDKTVKHIEDRLWAKEAIAGGWKIAYTPEISVYHYHGLHQHGKYKSFRAEGVTKLLKQFADLKFSHNYEEIYCRKLLCPNLIIVNNYVRYLPNTYKRLKNLISKFSNEQFCFVLCSNKSEYKDLLKKNIVFIERDDIGILEKDNFRELARKVLVKIEEHLGNIIDGLSFIDLSYKNINLNYLKLAKKLVFENNLKGVLPAWEDYGNYWKKEEEIFIELDINFELKEKKSAIYRSALGQGGCIRASQIRSLNKTWQIDELITTKDSNLILRNTND